MTLPCCYLIEEQSKNKELVQIKETLRDGKSSQTGKSKYISFDDTLHYLPKADNDLEIRYIFLNSSRNL